MNVLFIQFIPDPKLEKIISSINYNVKLIQPNKDILKEIDKFKQCLQEKT